MNGLRLKKALTNSNIFNFTMDVASGNASLEETQKWFEENTVNEYLS
jgi:hypothetical protein